MPAAVPVTTDSFLELIGRCDLIEPARLSAYLADLRSVEGVFDRPYRLARRMVADGLITHFQAEQLLKGRHKGFMLGNYRILERIGKGGMGLVYLGEHRRMRHRVALKVLPPEQAENPAVLERFYREARAAAMLTHPNLVRAHDIDCDAGLHYLVMEFVDGVTLHELVTRHGRLPVERAAHYIGQAAVGLEFASEMAGVVHRDIKPNNLLIDRTGTVKILDMGLARIGQSSFFDGEAESITKNYNDKSILGTADYIAPEQALNSQAADSRADIYSLGATFYFLLTGQPPFPTGTVMQKLMWHQLSEPTPVSQLRPDTPPELAALVTKMMAKDVTQRFQHPGEVVAALLPWIERPVAPPTDNEIPKLCLAAQGPASAGGGSLSSISLGGRLPRATRSSGETPNGLVQTDVLGASSDSLPRTPPATDQHKPAVKTRVQSVQVPQTPVRPRRWLRWCIAAAAALLVATGVAVVCKVFSSSSSITASETSKR